jgi:hypothetical protein
MGGGCISGRAHRLCGPLSAMVCCSVVVGCIEGPDCVDHSESWCVCSVKHASRMMSHVALVGVEAVHSEACPTTH